MAQESKPPRLPKKTFDKRSGELPPRPTYFKPPKPVVPPPAPGKKKD